MQEQPTKTVILRNVGHLPYNGDDKALRNVALRIMPGQQATLSLPKALQLIRDFPSCWQLVPGGDKEAEKELSGVITLSAVRQSSVLRASGPTAAPTPAAPQPASSAMQSFIRAALENKCQIETIKQTAPGFMRIIGGNGFVGAQTYATKVPLLSGEFGANVKKSVRYVLDAVEAPAPAAPTTKGVEEFAAPAPSRDRDPEDMGGFGGGDDDDLDEEDRHPSPGRRKARVSRPKDDDDED